MPKTDLTSVPMPRACRAWVEAADPVAKIVEHSITVDLGWWNSHLEARGLAGVPISGSSDLASGSQPITRGQLFELGDQVDGSPTAALTLLWHALAWGAGPKRRNMIKRMDAVAGEPDRFGALLAEAAERVRNDPVAAYELLAPGRRPAILGLGPAFFTKFLYFAAGNAPSALCLILDARVAHSLISAGWDSMHVRGGWPSATYGRYLELIARWHGDLAADDAGYRPRPDLIERWLFDNG